VAGATDVETAVAPIIGLPPTSKRALAVHHLEASLHPGEVADIGLFYLVNRV
jgi:hypothetical protein